MGDPNAENDILFNGALQGLTCAEKADEMDLARLGHSYIDG